MQMAELAEGPVRSAENDGEGEHSAEATGDEEGEGGDEEEGDNGASNAAPRRCIMDQAAKLMKRSRAGKAPTLGQVMKITGDALVHNANPRHVHAHEKDKCSKFLVIRYATCESYSVSGGMCVCVCVRACVFTRAGV